MGVIIISVANGCILIRFSGYMMLLPVHVDELLNKALVVVVVVTGRNNGGCCDGGGGFRWK